MSYKDTNYKPTPIFTDNADLELAAGFYASKSGVEALKAMPKGTRNEVIARQIQSLSVKKELANVLEQIRTTNPEKYETIIKEFDNPFALRNLGQTYKQLEGNVIDKLIGLYSGRKAFGSVKLPILNGEFQGNVGDYTSLVRANKKGMIPITR